MSSGTTAQASGPKCRETFRHVMKPQDSMWKGKERSEEAQYAHAKVCLSGSQIKITKVTLLAAGAGTACCYQETNGCSEPKQQ